MKYVINASADWSIRIKPSRFKTKLQAKLQKSAVHCITLSWKRELSYIMKSSKAKGPTNTTSKTPSKAAKKVPPTTPGKPPRPRQKEKDPVEVDERTNRPALGH